MLLDLLPLEQAPSPPRRALAARPATRSGRSVAGPEVERHQGTVHGRTMSSGSARGQRALTARQRRESEELLLLGEDELAMLVGRRMLTARQRQDIEELIAIGEVESAYLVGA